MAYIDAGEGEPVVFLHGNPTSSYLWRNIIPYLEDRQRCLAPDLVGMGSSGKLPGTSYRFVDHVRYLDGWFDALDLRGTITLVLHDWGSALGFYWAQRHPEKIKGIVYMEVLVRPLIWQEWPEQARPLFQAMRSPAGEQIMLEKNAYVERILPASVIRRLSDEEMEVYRRPYLQPGESRRPTLTWPREIPIEGEPADVAHMIDGYARWLAGSELPKLFINADPVPWLLRSSRSRARINEVARTGVLPIPFLGKQLQIEFCFRFRAGRVNGLEISSDFLRRLTEIKYTEGD